MFFRPPAPLTRLSLLGLLASVACAPASTSDPPNELHGVWSMTASDPGDGSSVIDPSQPGLYIFADGYYSAVYAPGPDLRIASEVAFQPTPDEMVQQYQSIIVNTGTYSLSGSIVTFRPIIAKSPAFVGGQATSEFQVNGDVLTLTGLTVEAGDGTSAPNVTGSLTFRRVE